MRRLRDVAILALLILWGAPARATYLPQERIPTDSPVYRDLERLATSYGVAPRFLSTRPLRRAEALAFLRGLAEARPGAAEDPAFRRAARLVDPGAQGATRPLVRAGGGGEGGGDGDGGGASGDGDGDGGGDGKGGGASGNGEEGERLEISPYVRFLYQEDPQLDPEINRDYRIGVAVAAAIDTSAVFVVDLYEGTASQGGRGTPDFGELNALVENVDFNSYVNEAYVEFPISRLRFLFGHTWVRWGPGSAGTLALSDAAPALDMLRIEADAFRKFRYSEFVSLLDPGPESYLAGHRLEWQAKAGLTAGFTELARFDGTSQAPLYLIPFVPYSFWEKRPKTGGVDENDSTGEALRKNNVLWSADVSWVPKPGWRAWAEFMLDDISFSTDYKPDMIGYQAGVEARFGGGVGGGGGGVGGGTRRAIGAMLEYTRVHNYTYSVFHNHDFSFDGFPTGFVEGPDYEALAGGLSIEVGADWEFRAGGVWRRKGEGDVGEPWEQSDGEVDAAVLSGVVEQEVRFGGGAIYSPARWLRVEGAVGVSDIEDWRHVLDVDAEEWPVLVRVDLSW